MRQYEIFELVFSGPEPESSHVQVPVEANFCIGNQEKTVKGFYAGNGVYKVRFLPEETGIYTWKVESALPLEGRICGEEECVSAIEHQHGLVQAKGLHFCFEDGTRYVPFGTTVYAMLNQEDALIEKTLETLEHSPFNKLRLCVFPKHYDYNHNEPPVYPFEKKDGCWDYHHPCFAFWDRFEGYLKRIRDLGIQCDLILFHGYDRWGFSKMKKEEVMTYLDYVMRRFSAYPEIWWSMANEYEVLVDFDRQWWYDFADFIHTEDPYGHLLSNHNFLQFWDFANENITHCSIQDNYVIRVPEIQQQYKKPVVFDECCYEGNIQHPWGNISGFELAHRFWTTYAMGGYCTHGETFLSEDEILWWAKGGILKGQSPKRIAFLKDIMEELPGDLDYEKSLMEIFYEQGRIEIPEDRETEKVIDMIQKELHSVSEVRTQGHFDKERVASGHCGEEAYLKYMGRQCAAWTQMQLSESSSYDVEVIDIWEMTRTKVLSHVSGNVTVPLPGKEGIAVLARRKLDH